MSQIDYMISSYIQHLEKHITPVLKHEVQEQKRVNGQFEYIALPPERFAADLDDLDKLLPSNGNFNFIDVGCGIGSKLTLASYHFKYGRKLNLHGIEITEEYVRVAKRLNPDAHVLLGDALRHHYANYDVIYFYQPMFNHKLQHKLEERIIKTAKCGAYIIAHLTYCNWRENDTRLQHVKGTNIYRKVKSRVKANNVLPTR